MKRSDVLRLLATVLWAACIGVAVAKSSLLFYVVSFVFWVGLLVYGVQTGHGIRWPSKNPDDYLRKRP